MRNIGIERASEEYLALRAYIQQQPPGKHVSYDAIEDATGVDMSSRENRAKFKRAAESLDIDVLADRDVGYILADPQVAQAVVAKKLRHEGNAAASTDKSIRRSERFEEGMTSGQRQRFTELKATRAALKQALALSERTYLKPKPNVQNNGLVSL